jgi:hypothetical protein
LAYNTTGLIKGNLFLFWKKHEQEYPVLAVLVRDILSTPASGASVEQLFNYARNICHYHRDRIIDNEKLSLSAVGYDRSITIVRQCG